LAIKDGWTVLDIGGQKGIFSVLAATAAKNVKVYTFEPSPDSFAALTDNIKLNGLSNVTLFNIAVGKTEGKVVLHLASDSVCNSLFVRSDIAVRGEVVVDAWPLQKILDTIGSPVDLLKMDIEGMEYDALLACPPEALSQIRRIALEYHDYLMSGVYTVRHLSEFLTANGFSVRLNTARRILMAWQP
jgi:FkbM family methyltransferase